MSVTIKAVQDAFALLHSSMLDPDFAKSLHFEYWGERDLLPVVRTFLLGYFGEACRPEVRSKLPYRLTGQGKVDFEIDDVAVEFAVRTPGTHPRVLGLPANRDELAKIMLHDGPAALVLFDFGDEPLSKAQIRGQCQPVSLGKGNFKKSNYSVLYYHKKVTPRIRLNVRVS